MKYKPSILKRYGFAIFTVIFILFWRVLLGRIVDIQTPYILFVVGIIASAWYGGFGAGFFSTFLAATFIDYFFLAPYHSLFDFLPGQKLALFIFIVQGYLISLAISRMHTAHYISQKRMDELKQSENRFKLLADNAHDLISILDEESLCAYASPSFERILGYGGDFILSRPFTSLIHENDRRFFFDAMYRELVTYRIRHANGTWRTLEGNSFMITSNGTNYMVHIARDISERIDTERRKDDFISMASHELRTPLTSIKLFMHLLQKTQEEKPKSERDELTLNYLKRVNKELNKLGDLIMDLLDVSKIQRGHLELREESFSLDHMIATKLEELRLLYPTHHFQFKMSVHPKIVADKHRLSQVVMNLLINAVKFSPEHTEVIIATFYEADRITVSIKDHGIGIEKEHLDRIFERFYRVYDNLDQTFPGLGIGLFTASEIIKRHGGKIWVESSPKIGSTFYFSLPLVKSKAMEISPKEARSNIGNSTLSTSY